VRFSDAVASETTPCPDDAVLGAFVDRTLVGDERESVEAHLDGCAACRETIGHVAATAEGEPRRIGRYRLDREIGRGGMGVVWQAWDPALERGLAIKVLRPELTDGHGRQRLVREARALAKLQHPNVVAVHDVGELADELFIATELVDGESMDRWQRAHSPAEILAAYGQAARGLAAAHELGLVHRDVKPSNILVGRDGRVRVGDFGLATRELASAPTLPERAPAVIRDALTLEGDVVGTPLYMAPEQRDGAAASARADQFSFCLALAEGLLGSLPDAGTPAAELAASGIAAPWDVIARGLAVRPADRHPSMAPLITALAGEAAPAATARARRPAWIAGGAAAVAAATIGGIVLLRSPDRDPAATCAGRAPLAGVWDAAARQSILDRFAATKLAYAGDAARAVVAAGDAFAAAHGAEDQRACVDAAARREPAEVSARRAACLGHARDELAAVLAELAGELTPAMIQRAPISARALPSPSTCGTPAGLAAHTIAADAATAARVATLDAQIGHATALRHLGKPKDARAVVESVLAEAKATGFLPLVASAQQELGTILHALDDPGAEQALVDGLAAAAEAHADFRNAAIAALLVEVVGDKGDVAAAERQAALARTAIIRGGNERRLEAVVERGLGRANQVAQEYATALAHYQRAEAIHAELGRTDDVDFDRRAQVLALGNLDRIDEATALNQRLLASDRANLGPKHPRTISDLSSGGVILFRSGRYAEAAEAFATASELDAETSGKDSAHYAGLRARLAAVYMTMGRLADAEPVFRDAVRVLALQTPVDTTELRGQRMNLAAVLILLGRYAEAEAELATLVAGARADGDRDSLALFLQNQGDVLARDGKYAEALASAREALAIDVELFGAGSRRAGEAQGVIGNALRGLGKTTAAVAAYEQAITAFETKVAIDAPQLGEPLTALGELRLAAKDAKGARPLFERAVTVLASGDPVDLARAEVGLAAALDAAGDRAGARARAQAALDRYRAAGDRAKSRAAAVEAWLAAHPAAP
jgi:eukaryotic-like serine/threonine-protein kinase